MASCNGRTAAGFAQIDPRLSREFTIGAAKNKRVLAMSLDAFNVLNRVNYGTFVGSVTSPLFGQPISARPNGSAPGASRLEKISRETEERLKIV